MTGRSYCIFDTAIARCGIPWGPSGIIGVQLPEVREIDTGGCFSQIRTSSIYPS